MKPVDVTGIRIERGLYNEISAIAKAGGQKVRFVIEAALKEYLGRRKVIFNGVPVVFDKCIPEGTTKVVDKNGKVYDLEDLINGKNT